jgi:integrase
MLTKVSADALPQTVSELFLVWKEQTRADGKLGINGKAATNGERTASDLANYQRALKDYVLGTTGAEQLTSAPVSLLALEEDRILEAMIRGTTLRKGRAPSAHLEGSLRSWMRRLLTDLAPVLGHRSFQPLPGGRLWQPYRTTLPGFKMANWPAGLAREFDALQAAYANRYYAGPGRAQLKQHRMKCGTWVNYRRVVNRVVEHALTVEGLTELTLLNLIEPDRVHRVQEWYFQRKTHGGYGAFTVLCMALGAVARYLEITGQLHSGHDAFSKLPSAPWMQFYALAKETEKDGHELGKVSQLPELPTLPPHEMEALAVVLSTGHPRRYNGRAAAYQIHRRRQAAAFYGIAPGAPVRIANWVGMQWGHNLYQDDQGHWWVYFRPEELKNGTRGKVPRHYRIKLPPSKGKWVDWWRAHLTEMIGPDFERVGYVFPGRRRTLGPDGKIVWQRGREDSFYKLIRNSCLEVRGHAYRPHAIRSDVTEYLLGRDGANMRSVLQAATLLGDTEQTVLKSYNKPDVQDILDQDYFAELDASD